MRFVSIEISCRVIAFLLVQSGFSHGLTRKIDSFSNIYMSRFAYACKTEGENGISRLISALCVNCLSSIPEYSRLNHLDVYLA